MNYLARCVPGVIALVASIAAASATAGAQAEKRADPADPGAAATPLRYESFTSAKAMVGDGMSPADNWKQANRTVAAIDSMSMTMAAADAGAAPTMEVAPAQAAAPRSDPHARHGVARPSAADPHAGHRMPHGNGQIAPVNTPAPTSAATQGGHMTPANKVPDPHAGRVMPPATPDAPARHGHKEKQ